MLTITQDNGKEFAKDEDLAEYLDVTIYFAHPYASWERGLNENTNGLIGQYFPKNRELTDIDPDESKRVVERLNHRPRKSLDYSTPHEVYNGGRKRVNCCTCVVECKNRKVEDFPGFKRTHILLNANCRLISTRRANIISFALEVERWII